MSIEIIEAAPSTLLTTVAAVKTRMGITTDENDDLIEDMIKAASDFTVNYCGREFALQEVKESLPGKGMPNLLLSLTPIIELSLVEYDDDEVSNCSILDDKAGIIQCLDGFKDTSFKHNTIDRYPSSFYQNRYHVTYTGGYVLPGWGSSQGVRTLPYDLEQAIMEMVQSQFSTRKFDGTVKSYKIGDTAITWDRSASMDAGGGVALPQRVVGVLNYYRRAF